ncbi:MAG: hypothetical protein JST39_05525, partial [Bacteroidetes bacterium]|nr:hypothetical protein [Bacteroidota bacterium]
MTPKRIVCCWMLLLIVAMATAQTKKIERLRHDVYIATGDGPRLKALLALCDEYQSLNRDTLEKYASQAKLMAAATHDRHIIAQAGLAMAQTHQRWGWSDSVLGVANAALTGISMEDPVARPVYFRLRRAAAMAYGSHSDFTNALSVLYDIIKQAELYHDSITLGANYNTIASIAVARSRPDEALSWLFKANAVSPGIPAYENNRAAILVNFASTYNLLGKKDSANWYIEKAIPICRRVENLNTLAFALRIQSALSLAAKQKEKAEAAMKEMMEIRHLMNTDMGVLADDNLQLIDFYLETGQAEKAIAFCKAALISGDLYGKGTGKTFVNTSNIRMMYYDALAKCYKKTGNTPMYLQTLEEIIAARDSFYRMNSAEAIAELQTRYEVQKKETTIIQQKLDLVRKNNFIYGSLGVAIFIGIISLLLFFNYRRRQAQKLQRLQEEEKRLAAEAVSKAEENERKRIAADLHDNLGAYAASVVSNIEFIPREHLDGPSLAAMQELRNNSQSMVAQLSDTIWVLKKDALSVSGISDRIKVFVRRIQPSYPHIRIEVSERLETDPLLPSSQAYHLFLLVQEAVNNALRHSRCKNIVITLESDSHHSRIIVSDDGTGFTERSGGEGNGLNNMRLRASQAGWSIEWTSAAPSGTRVVVSGPPQGAST